MHVIYVLMCLLVRMAVLMLIDVCYVHARCVAVSVMESNVDDVCNMEVVNAIT